MWVTRNLRHTTQFLSLVCVSHDERRTLSHCCHARTLLLRSFLKMYLVLDCRAWEPTGRVLWRDASKVNRSVLCALPNYACFKMRESEWCCFLLVSAMYAGLFVTHNEGHFFRCEGRPCTAPLPIWFVFGLLVFKLIVICESIWICDFPVFPPPILPRD